MGTQSKLVCLYVAFHKSAKIPSSNTLIPINSSRADGINIAKKNDFCELRAQYWVWKNERDMEFVGFFHFRRYLNLSMQKRSFFPNRRQLPYSIVWKPIAEDYTEDKLKRILIDYDLIAPIGENTGEIVKKRYGKSNGHRKEDLELIYHILRQRYPEYIPSADEYLNGTVEYFGNIYIMKFQLFQTYCKWLFEILEEFERTAAGIPKYTVGYIGERLFGIWFTYQKKRKDISWLEVPRIHFFCYDDKNHYFAVMKFINFFFPPGSKRRIKLKKTLRWPK